ncbi:hypothetical protein KOR34_21420 [Posidoniimonas corsicana]|uniref:PSP1 C-terminal domain-containing protein n=1 Tax=Posidoniimonas corsicana TaxID=1938618 RepID=A0A5C5VHH7_9BACT|nr:regulatory iron-sulfur-containing complex subunit RicT [Posidoniimonas corsicana]TWT37195.1 hypothetical protein KOR34_21420 [Posidoniimonas corsicana]
MPRYVLRYGAMRRLGVFSTRGGDRFARGHQVIARTSRGQESGEVLCEATDHVISQMKETRGGHILRLSTHDDEIELRKLQEQQQRELETCRQRVAELGLEMELVDVEHLYGGERVIFYYLAEDRVDFRELVKVLAKDFQTRIEMRQIGVRDEAKLLADYGDCGKPVCCNTHLSEMPPVSMKMAKLQKATLDPTKISGRCGRLKCCLRYEYDTYRDIQRELPRVGAEVLTREGKGRVLSQEILAGQLLIETEDSRRIVIDQSQVLSVTPRGGGGEAKPKQKSPENEADAPADEKQKGRRDGRRPKRQSRGDKPAPPPGADAGQPAADGKQPETGGTPPADDNTPPPPNDND